MEFSERKSQALAALWGPEGDKSPKGSVDEPIIPLISALNSHPSFFTTSSCSGRISVLSHADDVEKKKKKAGGGGWIFVTHSPADPDALIQLLFAPRRPASASGGSLVFRFEPLIIAVECRDLESAQTLVSTAISCGFRESGITSMHKRIMVAIRCSIRLEVPLGQVDSIVVSAEYVRYLVGIANEKMETNKRRADGFLHVLQYKGFSGLKQEKIDSNKNDQELSGPPDCSLSASMLLIVGEPIEKIFLWGQSACALNNGKHTHITVFGGFGGLGRHARQHYSLMLDPQSGMLKEIEVIGMPSPRLGHTSSVVRDNIFVIGGRGGPMQILNDVWVFDTHVNKWMSREFTGSVFHPRHRHAAAAVGSNIFVFGGLNNGVIYSCMYILNTENLQWSKVTIQGEWPCARHSHTLVANGHELFLFGGYNGKEALGDLYSFNVSTCLWKREKAIGRGPFPRFSHSMFVYNNYLGIIGGCPVRQQHQQLSAFDLDRHVWMHVRIDSIVSCLWVRSSTCIVGDDLVIIGGGASCYAFGTRFDPPMKINLSSLKSLIMPSNKENKAAIQSNEAIGNMTSGWGNHLQATINSSNQNIGAHISSNENGHCMNDEQFVLQLEKKNAKLAKDLLKKFGWLDLSRKARASQDGHHIHFPIIRNFYSIYQKNLLDSSNDCNQQETSVRSGLSENEVSLPTVLNYLRSYGGALLVDDLACGKKVSNSPQKIMAEMVSSLLQRKGMLPQLLEQLPTRWERLGDIAVLPVTSFKDPIWNSIGLELWLTVAKSLGTPRLARQGRILPTGTRDSTLEILVGDNGWVTHQENGILYSFDVTKCMFSSGNISEKLRMARLDCEGEIIVDLFAGIGYFVLPFLVKAKARLVYACEWNPHALTALRHNVHANLVENRCVILEGDNRTTAPKRVADRVCLGLLPSSECSWATAVNAVRTEGGILHVHGNVKDSEEVSWLEYVVESISSIARCQGLCWCVSIQHLERVKWYGPRIRHLVVDVQCKQL